MTIGFEAKRFFTNKTGLGNYNRFIVDALSQHFPEHTYKLYTPRQTANPDALQILENKKIEVVTPNVWYKRTRTTSLWRTWAMTNEPGINTLDVFHGLSQELPLRLPDRLKKIVTVHDLIFYRYPQFYNTLDVAIYKRKIKYTCKNADIIIAVSHQTKQDLQNFLNIDGSRIEVIHQGCHSNFKRKVTEEEIRAVKAKYGLPYNYILNVGTVEERKNVVQLIHALALLPPESRVPVVIIGKHTAYFKQVVQVARKMGVLDHLILPENVPFADFPAIYQAATLFVYPSLFEGFGIPLIEAIESGVPVITSKGSCFSEAAGPAALYVDPKNAEDLAHQIQSVLSDMQLRQKMIVESSTYIQQFAPAVIAGKIFEVYRKPK
jgi:glycosyltransferase involved in cell wall biosynthesis